VGNEIEIRVSADDKTSPSLEKIKKSAGSLKETFRDVGKTAAGVLTADLAMQAAQGFKNLVTDSVKQASDLNESINAVNVTFGASSKEIVDWGKQNAASFGLSQSAFNAMATPLGAGLKNAGLSMQDTSKWTIDLTKRAADMASVFNTSVPDALDAIQAGLRGEADPLERFGVGLSAAKVEAEALAETGKKTASSLTEQERATARLNLIMKQTAATQGDFANTSDGAANAARIASAQFDNAKASLGTALLPILAKAATAAATLAEGFNSLPGPMQATVVILGAVGTAAVLLGPKLKAAHTEMRNLGTGALSAETKLGGMARSAGKVAGALGAMATASALLSSDAGAKGVDTTRKALDEMRRSGKDTTGALQHIDFDLKNIDDSGRNAAAGIETFTGIIAEGLGQGWQKIDSVNQRMQALDSSLAGMVSSGNVKEAADDFELLRRKAEEQGTSVEKLKEFFPQYQNALDAAAQQNTKTADSAQKLTETVDQQREAINKATDALLGQRDSMRGLESSYDDATESLKKNGKTLDIGTEKGRANQDALDGIASAAQKASSAILEQGGSQAEANKVMATARGRFVAAATAMGMGAGEAKKLADKLFAIPKNTNANVNVNTGTANARLDALRAKLWAVQGLMMDMRAGEYGHGLGVYKATGGVVGRAATGGIRSNRVMVGEHGPEVMDLPPGTQVHSNPDTERMLGASGGSIAVRLEVDSRGGDDFGRFIAEMIRRYVRVTAGGNVQQALGRG
jgi:methyl-accepting chemotaxis protein